MLRLTAPCRKITATPVIKHSIIAMENPPIFHIYIWWNMIKPPVCRRFPSHVWWHQLRRIFIGQCTVAQQMLADFLHSKVGTDEPTRHRALGQKWWLMLLNVSCLMSWEMVVQWWLMVVDDGWWWLMGIDGSCLKRHFDGKPLTLTRHELLESQAMERAPNSIGWEMLSPTRETLQKSPNDHP